MFSIDRWKTHGLFSLAWGNTWEQLWSGDLLVRSQVDIWETTPAIWSRRRCNIGNKCIYRIVARTAGAGVGWLSRSHYQKDSPNWPGQGTIDFSSQEPGDSGSLWAHCWIPGHMTLTVRLGLETTACTAGSETYHLDQWLWVRRLALLLLPPEPRSSC